MADDTIPGRCPYPSREELEAALLAAELELLEAPQEVPG